MYELLMSGGFNAHLFCCLMIGSGLIGLSVGGAPGVGSLAGPVVSLGFVRFDKPQAIVTPLLVLGLSKCLFPRQRQYIQYGIACRALIPAAAGLVGGILFWAWLNRLPDSLAAQQIVKAICGLIVISISLDVLLARVLQLYVTPQLPWTIAILLAFLGGALSTIANVAGPLFAWYFQSKGLNKDKLTATVAFFFLTLNLLKLPFYCWLGLFHDPAVLQSVADWLIFAGLGGVAWTMWLVGAYWRKRATERWFSAPIAAAGLGVGCLILFQTL